jgi:FtsH-binding integral membrane protein
MLMFLIGVGAFMIYATTNTFYGKTEFGFILVLFGILLAGFFFVSGAVNEIKRNYFYGIVTLLTLGLGYILKYNSIVLSLIPIGFIAYKKFLTEHQE